MADLAQPAGLDEFLAQNEPAPSGDRPLAGATTPGEPPGLDAFIEPEMQQSKYGTPSQMAITAAEGLGRGLAGPLAPYLETKLGVKPEDIAGRAEANPVTHGGAEAVGLIGPAVATLGSATAARFGIQGAAEALPLIANASRFTQAGMLAKAGEGISALTGLGGEGAGLVSKVADSAIKGAFENALWSAGSQTGDYITGSDAFKNYKKDPNQAFETAMADIKFSGLLGGIIGGAVGGFGSKFLPEKEQLVSELDRPAMPGEMPPSIKLSPTEEEHLGGASYDPQELSQKFQRVSPEQFIEARSKSTKSEFLSQYTPDEIKNHKLYLTGDNVGFSLTPENDLVGVFNNSGRRGAGKEAVLHAISEGAQTLDAIDGRLPEYYNDFGFVETKRVPWDDAYAPKNWDYEKNGRPDIVYMELPKSFPRAADEAATHYATARMERAARRSGTRGPAPDVGLNSNGLFDWKVQAGSPSRSVGVDRPAIGSLESDLLSSGKITGKDRPSFLEALREQKTNTKDIKNAAASLGVPAFEGMTSASPVIQKAEDSLIRGNIPTVAGINRQKAYNDAIKTVHSQIDQATAAESKYSKAELGNIFKDSITSQLEEQVAPISQLYNEIKQYHQIIPLSEKSAPAIARNIADLDELRLSPSSPEGKLASRVIDEIGNLKTVDDVKNYKSILNRSISPTASSGEKRMVAILSDKLSDLEENSIIRFAKSEMKTPEAKQRVMNIIGQRELANAKYKNLMTDVKTLSEQLGKGRVYGPQDAMNFINDRLTPEEVVTKLFDKRNSEFADFFSKKYPEQMQLMRDYQRGIIRDNPASPGEMKAPKALFKSINQLEPEIRNKLYSPEELQKLGAAKTWLDAVPQNFNPSGTANASAFRSFFEHGVTGMSGAVAANVRDWGIEKFIKAVGQDQRLVTAAKLAQATIRGETAVTNAAKKVFNPDALVLPIHHDLTDSKRDKIEKHIDNMTTDPSSMMTAGIQHNVIPEYAQASAKIIASGVAYLQSLKPSTAKQNPLDSKRVPTKAEYATYHNAIAMVEQPLTVLNKVKDGTVNSQDMKTLNAVYPNLYTKLKDKLSQALVERADKDKLIPYKTKLGMSLFMGQPLDSTMTPQAIQAVQTAGMNVPSQPQGGPPPGKQHGQMAKLDKLAGMYGTPLTARQQSRQK